MLDPRWLSPCGGVWLDECSLLVDAAMGERVKHSVLWNCCCFLLALFVTLHCDERYIIHEGIHARTVA
jgi:hypothetical protein